MWIGCKKCIYNILPYVLSIYSLGSSSSLIISSSQFLAAGKHFDKETEEAT